MHVTEIWESKRGIPSLIRLALFPFSVLYGIVWEVYLAMYRLGLKQPYRARVAVMCVGNLVVGGSGKSPLVQWLAAELGELGYKVVIGCSGYGSPHAEAATLAPAGPLDPAAWGDEPAMFRDQMPDVPIIVGRRRVLAAQIAEENFPDALLLMDDGFQHLPLHNDISIVLDASRPKNGLCLPAGPYRELRRSRRRATYVFPGAFHVEIERLQISAPVPSNAVALCAIGQPARFAADLAAAGINLIDQRQRPDHDSLQAGTLFDGLPSGVPIIVTAKDWVKLRSRPDLTDRTILVARQRISVQPREAFLADLKRRIDEATNKTRRR